MPFGSVSVPSGFFDVRDISTLLNSCQCVSASPSSRASTKSKRPSAAFTDCRRIEAAAALSVLGFVMHVEVHKH
eukprot:13813382-Ditylum_brightwellii.AAC.1